MAKKDLLVPPVAFICNNSSLLTTLRLIENVSPGFFTIRPCYFFFVYCRMHFLILGRSVGKKKAKIKLEKESGARRQGTSA